MQLNNETAQACHRLAIRCQALALELDGLGTTLADLGADPSTGPLGALASLTGTELIVLAERLGRATYDLAELPAHFVDEDAA